MSQVAGGGGGGVERTERDAVVFIYHLTVCVELMVQRSSMKSTASLTQRTHISWQLIFHGCIIR